MYQIITQIVVYITLASIVGFIVGWLFSKLRYKEKNDGFVQVLEDQLAIVKAKKNELEEELIAKSSEYLKAIDASEELKKKYLTLEMDYEELLKQQHEAPQVDDEYVQKLENEKYTLTTQLQEYKEKFAQQSNLLDLLETEKNKNKELEEKLKTTTEAFEQQKQQLTNNIGKLQSENKFLVDRLSVVEDEKLRLKNEIDKLNQEQDKVSDIENKLKAKDEKI